jgi:hypothetical protein
MGRQSTGRIGHLITGPGSLSGMFRRSIKKSTERKSVMSRFVLPGESEEYRKQLFDLLPAGREDWYPGHDYL